MLMLIHLTRDNNGDAVVEAAILFPIMLMIFSALTLLAIYLPTHGALQRATQYAATALAAEGSDTWLFYNESSMSYEWETSKSRLKNVYVSFFSEVSDVDGRGRQIVTEIEGRSLSSKAGVLEVDSYTRYRVLHKEIVVTATRSFTVPVDLSFIGFPQVIPVTATSSAVILDGDEFIRNVDIAVDFVKYAIEKLGLSDIFETINSFRETISKIFGW